MRKRPPSSHLLEQMEGSRLTIQPTRAYHMKPAKAIPQRKIIEEMRKKIRRMNDPHYLHTVSMAELYQTTYKSRPPVIDGLLYSGAYILAGAPKIGKSFLVAQLAYHVSTGQRLWGYEVHQGTVLYLALEDDFQRIQSRMFMMYGVADTASLHFATAANKIGNGLDEQLENFIKEHPRYETGYH